MRKLVKASLLLMAILTVVYAGLVYVYANANSSNANSNSGLSGHRYIVHAAFEYESETPPTEWYTPEQLGIVKIIEYGENNTYWLHVVVDREKEPFPILELQEEELPIFKYKDNFYQISAFWVTPGLSESAKGQLIGGGVLVGLGWVFTGVLFLKGRKEE